MVLGFTVCGCANALRKNRFAASASRLADNRKSIHAGLNKSEQRHALAQVICTFRQERIAERSAKAQQFRASGLNLVIAAIAASATARRSLNLAARRGRRLIS